MSKVWREYGAIVVLLIVAIGGYLFLSRSEDDLVSQALGTVTASILALVPEGQDRTEAMVALSDLEERMADRELQPEQMERLAASVLNLHSSGVTLGPEEAEMLVSLAMNDTEALPTPEASPAPRPPDLPTHARKAKRSELVASAERVESMFKLFDQVKVKRTVDSAMAASPPVRFYTDRGIKALVDERLRDDLRAGPDSQEMLEWQARLAESVEAEMDRLVRMSTEMSAFSWALRDSMTEESEQLRKLAMFKKLQAGGFVFDAAAESLAVALEGRLREKLTGSYSLSASDGGLVIISGSPAGESGSRVIANPRPPQPPTGRSN